MKEQNNGDIELIENTVEIVSMLDGDITKTEKLYREQIESTQRVEKNNQKILRTNVKETFNIENNLNLVYVLNCSYLAMERMLKKVKRKNF